MKQSIKYWLLPLLLSFCIANAFAYDCKVDGIYYDLDSSNNTASVVSGDNKYSGDVVIPENINYNETTYTITSIGNNAFENCSGLTSVTMPNSITSIDDNAFYGCSGLTSVTIPNLVTYIGDSAFYSCTNINSLTIGMGVLSIGYNAFSTQDKNSLSDKSYYYYISKVIWLPNTPPKGMNEVKGIVNYVANKQYTGLQEETKVYKFLSSMFEVGGVKYVPVSPSDRTCDAIDCVYGRAAKNIYISNTVSYNGESLTVQDIGKYTCFGNNSIRTVTIDYHGGIGAYAFSNCASLETVTLKEGIKSIGSSAFSNCGLKGGITIPNSVESLDDFAFSGCSVLEYATIGSGVKTIGLGSFRSCKLLLEFKIPKNVESIGNSAFDNCISLASVIITNRETELSLGSGGVNINKPLFSDCPLKTVYIGGNISYPTSKDKGYSPFYGKTSLESVTISNSVTSFGDNMFSGCTGLTAVKIPDSVTSIGSSAFSGCSGLTSMKIPNSVTSIENSTFRNCSGLTSATIPNSVTSIRYDAFFGCSSLKFVTIPNSVTSIGNEAFSGCDNLNSLTIGMGVLSIGKKAFFSDTNRRIRKIIWLPNTPPKGIDEVSGAINYVANKQYTDLQGETKVYKLLRSMFEVGGVKYVPISLSDRTCDAIDCVYGRAEKKIYISNTVLYNGESLTVKDIKPYTCFGNDSIRKVTIDYQGSIGLSAFEDCTSLESVTLKEGLKSIGESAFSNCGLKSGITIPNSVESLGSSAFSDCSSLQYATIGSGTKSIESETFKGCESLLKIEIPKNVESIGNSVFDGCSALASVTIADRETELSLGSNGSNPLFSDCPLKTVYIGGNISYPTSKEGYSPFYRNTSLETVTITDKETEISENEFYGCTALKSISMGDGVESIGNWAFSGCASLDYFAFGSGMKTIGNEAFSNCSSMTKLISKAAVPPTCGTQALDDINKWNCRLIVLDNAIDSYKSAEQWKEFFFIEGNSGVESVAADGISVTVSDGKIIVEGAEERQLIEVYGTNGLLMYKGTETTIDMPTDGIYIVRIAGKAVKVAINR